MIHVGRKHDLGAEYVGRPSPLGNPFSHKSDTIAKYRVKTVDEALALYSQWLDEQIKIGNSTVIDELKRLQKKHEKDGVLVLGCWCSPKRCHADSIKQVLELAKF